MKIAARHAYGVLVLLCGAGLASTAMAQWQEIDASAPFVDRDGNSRWPSCAGAPLPGGTGIADTDFSFFVRPGNPKKLAIFWDGGGACWDPNTCVGTALAGSPIYGTTVDETAVSLAGLDGLGDFANPENPIADYTQVFIPYCTGDLHTGARDTLYQYQPPAGPTVPWTIHHRGADNVAAVLDWLVTHYETDIGYAPSKVFLIGASAGGYGVLYHYPWVADLLPASTTTRVLVDAANGVINQDFYDRALSEDGAWGVREYLAPELEAAFNSGPDQVVIRIFRSLGAAYPRTRFGQYTTAFDATQIGFYNIARHVDNPALWLDPAQLAVAALDWTLRARLAMLSTAITTWNYRYYLARGTDHTIVPEDKYYLETSGGGVAFVDWVDDMLNRTFAWGSDWRNVSCAPSCLP